MTDITMALMELLRKHELDIDSDFLREGVQLLMQMLIELEASEQIGAGRYERNSERVTQRNGYRPGPRHRRSGPRPHKFAQSRHPFADNLCYDVCSIGVAS